MSAQPMDVRMARLEGAYEQINERLASLERHMDARFDASERNWAARFGALEQHMSARFGALEQHMNARFGALEQHMSARFADSASASATLQGQMKTLTTLVYGSITGIAAILVEVALRH